MNAFLSLDGIELWHLAGWTMVHFLWLGALVVAAAAVCRFLLRRTSPSIRYAFMCAWLLALAALPFGTAAWLYQNSPPMKGGAGGGIATAATSTIVPALPIIELHQPETNRASESLAPPLASGASPNLSPQTPAPPNPSQPTTTPATFWPSTLNPRPSTIDALTTLIPYLPWLWLIGTPITFVLLITGVVGTRRLNRASQPITEGPIAALLSQLTESLRISRRVTVAACDRIAAPVLIGIIRPVILLPPAALTGWSPDEIEMVLLHELAHVRRWDNFMNLLQRVGESLLFFHPAVWILSSWVRSDREACCDALVVRRTNRPHAYAEMLVALAAQMPRSVLFHSAASSAMAAGPLRSRIRRILQLEDDPMLVSGKSFVLVLGALAVAATLGVLYVPTIGEAKEKPAKSVARPPKQAPADRYSSKAATPQPVLVEAVPVDQIPAGASSFSMATLYEARSSAKELVEAIDALISVNKVTNKKILIAYPPNVDGKLEGEMREALKKYVDDGRLVDVSSAHIKGDQIKVFYGEVSRWPIEQNVEPAGGFADSTANANLKALFEASEENPIETRTYEVSPPQRRSLDACFEGLQRDPFGPQLDFEVSWSDNDQHLKIKAPKLAHEKMFAAIGRGEFDRRFSVQKPNLPPVPPTNDMLAEALSKNNMKAISIAALNYNEQHKRLPPHAIYSADGKPLLSWRVALLPYLGKEEQELYKQFHLDEPWDSEHNRKLVASIPILFVIPKAGLPPVYAGKTNYLAVVGPECIFDGTAKGSKFKDIPDGTANTIAFVEANVDQAVEWTKPDDWQFDRQHPTKGLGTVWTGHWNAALVDGSQKQISNNTPADVVSAQFTRAGGEVKQFQESADRPQPPFGEPPIGLPGALAPPGTAAAAFAENPFGDLTTVTNPEGLVADNWPMGVAFPSPKEGKISADAWHKLKIKVVPAAKQEQAAKNTTEIKVVAGIDPPPGVKKPVFLLAINDHPARTFDELAGALAAIKNEKLIVAKCVTTADFGPLWIDTALDPSGDPRRSIRRESGVPPAASAATAAKSPSKFPSLEDQKLADLAFKRLNLELEPIGADDLQRVKALGYDGGVKVANTTNIEKQSILTGDILVGLHVWPTTSVKEVIDVLKRDDLAELNPLKFYVVRQDDVVRNIPGTSISVSTDKEVTRDRVVTGRYTLFIGGGFGGSSAKPARNAPSTTSDAWPSTPATNTWPPANSNDLWQSAPAVGPPLEPAYPQGSGGVAPTTRPVHVNDLPGVPKSPFQTLPTAPVLNSNDASVSPPGTAPVLAPPPTDSYAVPPPATLNVLGAALPSEPTSIAAEAPPARSILRQRTTPNGQVVYESFPSTTAPSDKSNLRYDGKTFDQWRSVWQTELSTEKRIEAIKALAAFGRAGYGKEATETILDVAGEYDFYILEGDQAPEGKLKESVLDELTPPYRAANLAQYWVPEVVARMKKDPKKWQWLAENLFTRLRTKDPDVIAKLQLLAGTESPDVRRMALYTLVSSDRLSKPGASVDKKTQDLIDAALESKNAEMIRSTLTLLPYHSSGMGMGGGGGRASADSSDLLYRPALLPLLLDSDEQVRRQARQVASNITEQDSGDVIKYLLGILNDKARERDHLEAVRGLAAVAERGRLHMQELNAVAALQKICKNPDTDEQMFVAAHAALLIMFPSDGAKQGSSERSQLEKLYGGSSEEEFQAVANRLHKISGSSAADFQKEIDIVFNKSDPNTANSPGGGVF